MNRKFKCICLNKIELTELLLALRMYQSKCENAYEYQYLFRLICKLQRKLDELGDSELNTNNILKKENN